MSAGSAREDVYHAGERYVQDRAHQAAAAAAATGAINAVIPPPAADFLAERELLIVAAADRHGRVWTTHLAGAPGFIEATDGHTMRVARLPLACDPLAGVLQGSVAVGTIAIDFATRRRVRLNGMSTGDAAGLTISSKQVFANCPKFIAARSVVDFAPALEPRAAEYEKLNAASRRLVTSADTFFIGTVHWERGADASHRGGSAGFVAVLDERTLRWPDYRGNAMYMTLGNIAVSSRTGLLFVDWERGDALQLTGHASINWDPELAAHFPGAQRMITFTVERAIWMTNASPLRWSHAMPSRVNPKLT